MTEEKLQPISHQGKKDKAEYYEIYQQIGQSKRS